VQKAAAAKGPEDPTTGIGIVDRLEANITQATKRGFSPAIGAIKTAAQELGKVFTNGVNAAKSAATDLLSLVAEGLGQAIGLPGLGGALAPLFGALAQGPDEAKKQATAFAEALPDMVVNIVEALIEALPHLIDELVRVLIEEGGLLRIVDALVRVIPRVGLALGAAVARAIGTAIFEMVAILETVTFADFQEQFNRGLSDFVDELNKFIDSFHTTANNLVSGIAAWFKWLPETLGEWFTWLVDSWQRITTPATGDVGIRGGSGTIGNVIGVDLGFQKGGIVPPGFPRDSALARLSSNELVVPSNTTQNLFDAINGIAEGDVGGDGVVPALLVRVINLLEQPQMVNTTAEVNGNALADIMVELNRTNVRTAV
jgi:hypothetical protein